MFDRLEDIVKHYEELMFELNNPSVAEDQKRFRKLMKEQSDLTPLVETYKEYKQAKQDVEDSLALLEEESDEEMREMAKEELSDAKKRIEELEQQLTGKIGLLPATLVKKVMPVGNAAGEGAKIALVNEKEMLEMDELVRKIEFVELAASADFQDHFIDEL